MNDGYGTTVRERMKESMGEPFIPRNRRTKPEPSWWDRHHSDVGLSLYMIVVILAGSCGVMTLDKVLQWFR